NLARVAVAASPDRRRLAELAVLSKRLDPNLFRLSDSLEPVRRPLRHHRPPSTAIVRTNAQSRVAECRDSPDYPPLCDRSFDNQAWQSVTKDRFCLAHHVRDDLCRRHDLFDQPGNLTPVDDRL